MWQDEYISKNDNQYICWDREGEFVALCDSLDLARKAITEYCEKMKRPRNEKSLQ